MDHLIQFHHIINSSKLKGLNISIYPLKIDDFKEAIQLISNSLRTRDVLTYHLNIPAEEHMKYIELYCERSLQDGLAFVCKDDTSPYKIIAVDIAIDLYREHTDPIDFKSNLPEDTKVLNFEELFYNFRAPEKMNPKKPYQIILNVFGIVDEDYINLGILSEMYKFLEEEHPIGSKAELILSEVTNGVSARNHLKSGYKTLGQIQLKYYSNSKGINPFEGYEGTIEKLGGLPFDRVYMMAWRKTHGCVH